MALSKSCLRTHAKVTLPSVEGGLGSMNILKDPPKSIHTRKIDKVGEDNRILEQMACEAPDRFCENISTYARGVNPMVGVSYNNFGNTSSYSRQASGIGGTNYAKLPYRIMNGGAFRPPVVTQRELLPLSRQPRGFVEVKTLPTRNDYSKKLVCQNKAKNYREIKNRIDKKNVASNYSFIKKYNNTPEYQTNQTIKDKVSYAIPSYERARDQVVDKKNYESKYMLKDTVNATAVTNRGVTGVNIEGENNLDITKYIKDVNQIERNTNKRINYEFTKNYDTSHILMRNPNHSNVKTNISDKRQCPTTKIQDLFSDSVGDKIKNNVLRKEYSTIKTMKKEGNYITTDMELKNRMPVVDNVFSSPSDSTKYVRTQYQNTYNLKNNRPDCSATSAISGIGNTNISSTDFNRNHKRINYGEYKGTVGIPTTQRQENNVCLKSSSTRDKINELNNQRFNLTKK